MSIPFDHPFPKLWAHNPPVKTRIANCCQTAPDTTFMTVYGNIPSLHSTVAYHRRPTYGHPSQKGVVKKLDSKMQQNNTQPIG